MNPLFSKASLMILESLSFTKTLYAFDFDGTLSKIVRTPNEATLARTTEVLLKRLSEFAPVAILSGRSIADLKTRLGFQPKYLIGNHGLEGLGKNNGSLNDAQSACELWKKKLKAADFGVGTEIEDKTYSLAIHYRRSRNKKFAKEQIRSALSSLHPQPRVVTGKSVVNLLPIGAPHKGVAVLELMKKAGMKHSFFIGDDDTDEDVFELPEARIVTARVGYKKSSHAQFYIERQNEINQLLRLLIRFHEQGRAKR